jgi:hypothetical protein
MPPPTERNTQNDLSRVHKSIMLMRAHAIALIVLLSLFIVVPAMAINEDRYSYITIQDVVVRLDNETATIHVSYSVDESTRFIFFLLGKQDLKNKLLKILNYDDAQMKHIDLSSADFIVNSAVFSYGNGIYWYPSHDFNVVIPLLVIQSPQANRNFTNVKQFPGGMGYFAQPGLLNATAPVGMPPR